ncbi:hypothetical protein RD055328_09590 [Companilactobacillus sp. RD055328]|uniref:hypothetical protein n=1 Tax=Companilactobacillus sp. RD055328 TaxID=2916634 RepID=UPI001FC8D5E3|nr:hypothetical protein [Companilactobacillus sp. RD055328]GKQ43036.1 hypothetical protein RD055328_09590 [Companilactobacillus sp. RD055328]
MSKKRKLIFGAITFLILAIILKGCFFRNDISLKLDSTKVETDKNGVAYIKGEVKGKGELELGLDKAKQQPDKKGRFKVKYKLPKDSYKEEVTVYYSYKSDSVSKDVTIIFNKKEYKKIIKQKEEKQKKEEEERKKREAEREAQQAELDKKMEAERAERLNSSSDKIQKVLTDYSSPGSVGPSLSIQDGNLVVRINENKNFLSSGEYIMGGSSFAKTAGYIFSDLASEGVLNDVNNMIIQSTVSFTDGSLGNYSNVVAISILYPQSKLSGRTSESWEDTAYDSPEDIYTMADAYYINDGLWNSADSSIQSELYAGKEKFTSNNPFWDSYKNKLI